MCLFDAYVEKAGIEPYKLFLTLMQRANERAAKFDLIDTRLNIPSDKEVLSDLENRFPIWFQYDDFDQMLYFYNEDEKGQPVSLYGISVAEAFDFKVPNFEEYLIIAKDIIETQKAARKQASLNHAFSVLEKEIGISKEEILKNVKRN